ncbi:uncharacterized protein MYCFIDRAFT_84790 [Pseudocercospora fijiensis CIRAD86]|uniref:F-box domain-containing protein n=1 Tax=Pseudocercospora fijiensis (strain CIRAD86) TaxID=383855 RepID=M3AJN0_PSEFD|nr:uncharacterized protein MYCFIDRAFT_84790 [Pseudocercospora fijiensis CIRAD86]EME77677.1 hypothetical protein MYCFIDRAFT_84790 [Pseudocercospora fijiensis CIRAD86]
MESTKQQNGIEKSFPFFHLPPELRSIIYTFLSSHDSYYPEVFDFRCPLLPYCFVSSRFRYEFLKVYHASRYFTIWNITRPMEKSFEKCWTDVFMRTRLASQKKFRFWTVKGIPLEIELGRNGMVVARTPYEKLDERVVEDVRGMIEVVAEINEDGETRMDGKGFRLVMNGLRERGLLHLISTAPTQFKGRAYED